MPRILIADDEEMLREMIAHAAKAEWPDAQIGYAHDYATILKALESNSWNLLVLDMNFGDGRGGLDVLTHLRFEQKAPSVLVLTSYSEKELGARCISMGARGYIEKGSSLAELVSAMKRVLNGDVHASPKVTSDLALLAQGYAVVPHKRLTSREYQVFLALASGRTVTQVAEDLNLSPKTVGTHRAAILDKLQLDSNAALVRYALENQLLHPSR